MSAAAHLDRVSHHRHPILTARRAHATILSGVAETLRAIPAGKNAVTNYRGLPAVSYREMSDFDLQQEVCAKAGITGRIISNPFAAEVIASISSKPAIDVVKHVNDQNAAVVALAPATSWGLGTLNPLDASHIAEGERCLGPLVPATP